MENCTLIHCHWGYILVQPLWKTIWICRRNLEINMPYFRVVNQSYLFYFAFVQKFAGVSIITLDKIFKRCINETLFLLILRLLFIVMYVFLSQQAKQVLPVFDQENIINFIYQSQCNIIYETSGFFKERDLFGPQYWRLKCKVQDWVAPLVCFLIGYVQLPNTS